MNSAWCWIRKGADFCGGIRSLLVMHRHPHSPPPFPSPHDTHTHAVFYSWRCMSKFLSTVNSVTIILCNGPDAPTVFTLNHYDNTLTVINPAMMTCSLWLAETETTPSQASGGSNCPPLWRRQSMEIMDLFGFSGCSCCSQVHTFDKCHIISLQWRRKALQKGIPIAYKAIDRTFAADRSSCE